MSVHKAEITSMTALWPLPIVSTIVCAATGGIVAGALSNSTHTLWTLVVSYILCGIGVPLAMITLVLYYHRLTMHKIPPREAIASVFLPLGPLGEGGFGIMTMGQVSLTVFPATNTLIPWAGQIMYVFGFFAALLMWGFGLAWLFWALASFGRSKSPFNMGWWDIIFATGVFTGSTITLGQEMPSRFFNILGTVSFINCLSLKEWNSGLIQTSGFRSYNLFCFGLSCLYALSVERSLGISFSPQVLQSLRLQSSRL
jgi:tellurite resistance protein TehA-like permease